MPALYNEVEPGALAALAAVMEDGLISPGRIEPRSIKDLTQDDLEGFEQVHLFAGAGSWSHAARLAGWPDWLPLWTASCPCQPFSQAGRRSGTADERHLWPDVFRLVRARRPPVVVGEQVAGKAGYDWFDGVRANLGGAGYRTRVVDIPAAAVDAPHIRQRLYWVAIANTAESGLQNRESGALGQSGTQPQPERSDVGVTLGDAIEPRLEGHPRDEYRSEWRAVTPRSAAAANGSFWSDHDWLQCHDGKARRTKPGLRLLVDGRIGRIPQWRIAGNGIVVPLAAEVLAALLETLTGTTLHYPHAA